MDRRLRVELTGIVQGVGFRPHVLRLANALHVAGWVANDTGGVQIEVEGAAAAVDEFVRRMLDRPPAMARIDGHRVSTLGARGELGFVIRPSGSVGPGAGVVTPDWAVCSACRVELNDPEDRRFQYPFINCTDCGPRFSIIEGLPYDRRNTTMAAFVMCPRCRAEYLDPANRRFHAEPNACPDCGPRLEIWSPRGEVGARENLALEEAVGGLGRGEVVAVKGLGGFQLMVDATNAGAVARLRQRKQRPAKPLAVMVSSRSAAEALCQISPAVARALTSPSAPIVLAPRRAEGGVADNVAPGGRNLGVFLPTTPLHHLIVARMGRPLVVTSGNRSGEPICIDEREALERLGLIADRFLVHNRPIRRHVDDSVVREIAGQVRPLRRARGLVPLPLAVPGKRPIILAVGGHQKNTVALGLGEQVVLSQHLGDLVSPMAREVLTRTVRDLLARTDQPVAVVAHDEHPEYGSTRWVLERGWSADPELEARLANAVLEPVQHHHAHLAACLAEHGRDDPALGVTWDGAGWGSDHTVWGGEILLGNARRCERVARLRPFVLPGGAAAIRAPWRVAWSLLWQIQGGAAHGQISAWLAREIDLPSERVLTAMVERQLSSPWCSSVGRLFDAVAVLVGRPGMARFEGELAIQLESLADPGETGAYDLPVVSVEATAGGAIPGPRWELDWRPLVTAVVADRQRGLAPEIMAARFHNGLAEAIGQVAERVGEPWVALTGGCFQNRLLVERAVACLERRGFSPLLHWQTPPNDGSLSLGQVMIATARWRDSGGQETGGHAVH